MRELVLLVDYHRKKRPIFKIYPDDISWLSADKQMAFGRHALHITVEQHLFSCYKRTLRYPFLPCIITVGGPIKEQFGFTYHKNYYPIEYLYLTNNDDDYIGNDEVEASGIKKKMDTKINKDETEIIVLSSDDNDDNHHNNAMLTDDEDKILLG